MQQNTLHFDEATTSHQESNEETRTLDVNNVNHVVLHWIDEIEAEGWEFVKETKIHDADDEIQESGFVFTQKVRLHFKKVEAK